MGLVGAGLATLAANFLYFLQSIIFVIPNLNIYFPRNVVLRIVFTFIPTGILLYIFKTYCSSISGVIQMCTLLVIFYVIYNFGSSKLINIPE